MKKWWLFVLISILFSSFIVYADSSGLNEVQLAACESADTNDNCDQLQDFGISKEQCCSDLNLCCTNIISSKDLRIVLINILRDYFISPGSSKLTVDEIRDLITIYFSSKEDTINLDVEGKYSKETLISIYNKAKGVSVPPSIEPVTGGEDFTKIMKSAHKMDKPVYWREDSGTTFAGHNTGLGWGYFGSCTLYEPCGVHVGGNSKVYFLFDLNWKKDIYDNPSIISMSSRKIKWIDFEQKGKFTTRLYKVDKNNKGVLISSDRTGNSDWMVIPNSAKLTSGVDPKIFEYRYILEIDHSPTAVYYDPNYRPNGFSITVLW